MNCVLNVHNLSKTPCSFLLRFGNQSSKPCSLIMLEGRGSWIRLFSEKKGEAQVWIKEKEIDC